MKYNTTGNVRINVISRRARVTIVGVEKAINIAYCVCVCVCVTFSYPAYKAHAPCCHLWCALLYHIFSTLSHKRQDFQKTVTEYKKRDLIFSTTFV